MQGCQRIRLPGAELDYYESVELGRPVDELFAELLEEVQWRSETITLFGKRVVQPRLLAWYADRGLSYTYSRKRLEPLGWIPALSATKAAIEAITAARFNSVLANLYRDHRDSMGLHADDEPELGERPVIASLSLGEERTFRIKHRSRRDLKALRLPLPSGSLLVMRGDTQRYWRHEVPKSRLPCGPRINLTFRFVNTAEL